VVYEGTKSLHMNGSNAQKDGVGGSYGNIKAVENKKGDRPNTSNAPESFLAGLFGLAGGALLLRTAIFFF